jgi:hypothetical protein
MFGASSRAPPLTSWKCWSCFSFDMELLSFGNARATPCMCANSHVKY